MSEQNSSVFDLQLDDMVVAKLRESAKWSRYMVVIIFVIAGILTAVGLMCLIFGQAFGEAFQQGLESSSLGASFGGALTGTVLGIALIVAALFVAVLAAVLGKFSKKVKDGLALNDQMMVAEGVRGLKIYFTISGVIGILSLISTFFQAINIFF